MEEQLVVFDLADEYHGVDIDAVEGIIKMQAITAIPHAPGFVRGVTNLRGNILPVIDLRQRFGLPSRESNPATRIIVVEIKGKTVGIIVDGVSEVLRVDGSAIEPPPPMVRTEASTFIKGIAKVDERLIVLLDLSRLLTEQEQGAMESLVSAN